MSFVYRLHAADGDDLGFLEHPAPNVEPGDVVILADGRESIVTARVEARPGDPIRALLEVARRAVPCFRAVGSIECMQDYEEQQRREIEEWFRERDITLEYGKVGDPAIIEEWVALMIPVGHESGVVEGGGGPTKLAAARDAQERYTALHGDTAVVRVRITPGGAEASGFPPTEKIEPLSIVHERALGEPTVTAVPSEVREPLEKIAMEYGWYIGGVDEPDGSIRWFVFDREGATLLKSGVAANWDDARLALIEDLYPPSGEV